MQLPFCKREVIIFFNVSIFIFRVSAFSVSISVYPSTGPCSHFVESVPCWVVTRKSCRAPFPGRPSDEVGRWLLSSPVSGAGCALVFLLTSKFEMHFLNAFLPLLIVIISSDALSLGITDEPNSPPLSSQNTLIVPRWLCRDSLHNDQRGQHQQLHALAGPSGRAHPRGWHL